MQKPARYAVGRPLEANCIAFKIAPFADQNKRKKNQVNKKWPKLPETRHCEVIIILNCSNFPRGLNQMQTGRHIAFNQTDLTHMMTCSSSFLCNENSKRQLAICLLKIADNKCLEASREKVGQELEVSPVSFRTGI